MPLQGVGLYTLVPRALPWAGDWLPFQGARGEGCGAAAPERGAYSRIGACPYLPPQLINSRCCPCKGRISWAGLAPQQDSRYEPLTGARFINRLQEVGASPYPKYEPLSGALARQIRDIRAALRGLKAQQVRSPGQRPGLTYVPHLRPVRAKVINNRCAHTFALTGRRAFYPGTQGVALGWGLAALSGRSRRNSSLFAPARPRNSLIRLIRCYAV